MPTDALAAIATAQSALLAALDTRDAEAIEHATRDLAAAIGAVKANRSDFAAPDRPLELDLALRQNEAARLRIGFLTSSVSDRLARLSEIREPARKFRYGRPGHA